MKSTTVNTAVAGFHAAYWGAAATVAAQARHAAPGNPLAAFLGRPGAALADMAVEVAGADTVAHIGPATPPFLLVHGSADRLISPSQALRLHTALRGAGVSSTRYVVRGAAHGDMPLLGPAAGQVWTSTEVLELVVGFLHEHPSTQATARCRDPLPVTDVATPLTGRKSTHPR